MTTAGASPRSPSLAAVHADLRIDVDGPRGRTSATLRGEGGRIVVEVADLRVALAALPRPTVGAASHAVAAARRLTRSTGITVDLRGPRGTLASVGPTGVRPGPGVSRRLAAAGIAASVVISAVVMLLAGRRAGRRHRT